MSLDLVPVLFKRHFAQYDVGDVAGFPQSRAQALVKSGVAEPYAKPVVASEPVATGKGGKVTKQADEKSQF